MAEDQNIFGVTRIKADDNMKTVAERRVGREISKYETVGFLFYLQDGKHYWFEVILADPDRPRVAQDKELTKRISQTA